MTSMGVAVSGAPAGLRMPVKPILVGVVGDEKVGTTSLVRRLSEKVFDESGPGQHLAYRTALVPTASGAAAVPLRVFDYKQGPGHRDNVWYRRLDVVAFVFDVTRVESLVNIRKGWAVAAHTWVENKQATGVILGNKADLDPIAAASMFAAARDTAASLGMQCEPQRPNAHTSFKACLLVSSLSHTSRF
jgi:GTPase SAR1 family protein